MNKKVKTKLIPLIAVLCSAGALPLSADLLFHEGFDYAAGSLNGSGGWTASGHNVESSTSTGAGWSNGNFDGVTQTGLFAGGTNGEARLSLDPAVTDTFVHGSSTWLGWLAIRVDSRYSVVAIGTGTFGDRAGTASGQNIGGGSLLGSANLNPSIWDPVGSTGNHQVGANVTIPANTLPAFLMMARIDWADGSNDTVTLAAFASGETISEAAFDAKVASGAAMSFQADLDQSDFDTLNVATSRNNFFDEIRIATTFEDAVTGTFLTDYETWSLDYPGLGLPGVDDDGDGLTNDEERLFGLDPTDPSSSNPFVVPFEADNGTFSYTRRTQALTELDNPVWFSVDLENWFRDFNSTQTAGAPANGIEIVDVEINPALLEQPKLFVRISSEPNVILPAPELVSVHGSNRTITLNFTQELYEPTAWDASNYTVELEGGGAVTVTGASLSPNGKSVTLTLGSDLAIASAYNVVFSNLIGTTGVPIAGGTTGQFQTWDSDPNGIKVFILAGQSNMVGHGKSEQGGNPAWTPENGEPKEITGGLGCLRYLAGNDASYPDVDYSGLLVDPGQPATSAWATRSDVKVWWKSGYVTESRTVRKGGLKIGYTDSGSWFGPEYPFGRVMGDHFASPVLIIKTAWGGIDLARGFRPPSAVAERGGAVGPYYAALLEDVSEALGNLATDFPAAQHPEFDAVGYRYQIVGFGWHQGWNDGGSAAFADEYEENLADLIDDLRAQFSQPALPVAIANSGFGGVGDQTGSRLTVRQAQDSIGSLITPHPVYSGTVLTDDTAPYWRDSSVSPSNIGFHWNHNAESHYLIGKGMADRMKILLP